MRILLDSTLYNVSLADFVECCNYTATTNLLLSPTLQATGLSGLTSNYTARIVIDSNVLVPERSIYVVNATNILLSGRPINLKSGSTLRIFLKGNLNDINADVTSILYNVTPVDTQEFVDISIPQINNAIQEFLPTTTIIVNSSRTVLGPRVEPVKDANIPHYPNPVKHPVLPQDEPVEEYRPPINRTRRGGTHQPVSREVKQPPSVLNRS